MNDEMPVELDGAFDVDKMIKARLCWACYTRSGTKSKAVGKSGLCLEHNGERAKKDKRTKRSKPKKVEMRKCLDCSTTFDVVPSRGTKRRCLPCALVRMKKVNLEYSREYGRRKRAEKLLT